VRSKRGIRLKINPRRISPDSICISPCCIRGQRHTRTPTHRRRLTAADTMAMATSTKMGLGSKVSLKQAPASRGLAQAARPLRCGLHM
jgi:hypothetical protein